MSLLNIDHNNKNAGLGYWIGSPFVQKGLSTEGVSLILNFGFNTLELERIYARVMYPNVPSINLLRKIGFTFEGKLRHTMFRENQWMDDLCYSMLRSEYAYTF